MYVDSYCERTAPGLWGEPLNAVTNAAFLIAAGLLLWLLAKQRRRVPADVWALPVILALVGLCSLAFHTYATELTGALDSLSILVFILTAVVLIVRRMWAVRWRWAWLAAPGFLVFSLGLNAALAAVGGERAVLGGYLPALVGLVGFGLALRLASRPPSTRYGTWLLGAAGAFAASLTLRTLDEPLCATLPIGTHFLWHCLNATVLFVVAYTVVSRWRDEPVPGRAAPAEMSGTAKG